EGEERISVEFVTLDSFYFGYFMENPVHDMKIDVDGYELKVLKGAKNIILKHKPKILIELSMYIHMMDGAENFVNFIKELEYKFYTMEGIHVSHDEVIKEFPYHTSCDMIILPKEKKVK